MKVAVFGSKEFDNSEDKVDEYLDNVESGSRVVVVMHDGKTPVAKASKGWCFEHAQEDIVFLPAFKVDNSIKYDVKYLFGRDRMMIHNSDEVVFFWDEDDSSLRWAMRYAKRIGKDVVVVK